MSSFSLQRPRRTGLHEGGGGGERVMVLQGAIAHLHTFTIRVFDWWWSARFAQAHTLPVFFHWLTCNYTKPTFRPRPIPSFSLSLSLSLSIYLSIYLYIYLSLSPTAPTILGVIPNQFCAVYFFQSMNQFVKYKNMYLG